MATFACKTRGNSSPQGKPRVFFCCHPADFSAYFAEITDEVLALQNCAIFILPTDRWTTTAPGCTT